MSKRLLYIYNPHAGRQRARGSLAEVVEVFSARGWEVTVHPTAKAGDATAAVVRMAPQFERIVCCGGDGTLNEVVRGMIQLPPEQRIPIGYIPTGTTNDFSRTLDLPKTTVPLAEMAASGVPLPVDVGEANRHPFTYVAAFGLFTDVSYSTPQASKQVLGHLAYVLEGASHLANIPSYHMTVTTPEGRSIEGDFIYGMVGNTVSVGGVVNLSRDLVKLDDGRFEVLLVRMPKTPEDWQSILAALNLQELTETGAVVSFTASEVTFTCDELVAWTVDGEFGGAQTVTTVTNHPRAVSIVYGQAGDEEAE